jgi:hypothetical protein
MLQAGQAVSINLKDTDQPPYRLHGTFVEQDEEYVKITGTVGDRIGKELVTPKSNIKFIEVL